MDKRLTKKLILEAIVNKTGVKAEYLVLSREQDGYYFDGKAGAVFSSTWVDVTTLNAMPLNMWVEAFESMLNEWKESSSGADLNAYIESIDWSILYVKG